MKSRNVWSQIWQLPCKWQQGLNESLTGWRDAITISRILMPFVWDLMWQCKTNTNCHSFPKAECVACCLSYIAFTTATAYTRARGAQDGNQHAAGNDDFFKSNFPFGTKPNDVDMPNATTHSSSNQPSLQALDSKRQPQNPSGACPVLEEPWRQQGQSLTGLTL